MTHLHDPCETLQQLQVFCCNHSLKARSGGFQVLTQLTWFFVHGDEIQDSLSKNVMLDLNYISGDDIIHIPAFGKNGICARCWVLVRMEVQNPQHGQYIEINVDVGQGQRRIGGSKLCGEAPCGFSDAGTSSKDAEERSASMRKLLIAVVLCVIFMSVEVVGGIKANSLAILTDAAHLLSDVAAFAISLFSLWAAGWEANPRQSYGFFRIEILGALVSIQLIWLLAGILVYEAIVRLINNTGEGHSKTEHSHHHEETEHVKDEDHHHDVYKEQSKPLLDKPKKRRNINVQGAYLHVLGDSIQSIGVMIGGAIIWYKPEWKIVDLICTLIFSVVVLGTTIKMLRSILEVLMESTPREIDATKLETGLLEMGDVVAIHELHIWAITVGKVLLACHVKIRPEADADIVLDNVIEYIRREYNISHVTIQIER
ncbi:hypothetical protein GOBAR_AA16809 [Gossypium barbadense]|uniref:Cation efflux protein cytoplasmic domain-containing protein n=1 Tax=Gossypium barbadense TaxID=3634 RepID=A0A2P5XKH9_GOSBA|nr:hypothetical protein GOBAR_AA16809 [Gossypium barbadense]